MTASESTPSPIASTDTDAVTAELADIGYAEAVVEIDEILHELDDDRIDIDVLSQRVERAAALIAVCRTKILAAEEQVAEIVSSLQEPTSADS